MLYPSWPEIGMIGDFSAFVPLINSLIARYYSAALPSCFTTVSILFWRMMMCFNFMISTAAKCSEVYGWGHVSFAAIKRRDASITDAPASIVAIKRSCPGQSTNETCLTSWSVELHPQFRHYGVSDVSEPPGW